MNVYIFGNGNISLRDFLKHYGAVLDPLVEESEHHFIVCDFRGADTLAMELLKTRTANVHVYHVGERARYRPDSYRTKVSQWTFRGGFSSDEERDDAAIDACTHFIAVDFNSNEKRVSGTRRNIERCLEKGKVDLSAP